jgi:ribosome-binding factor A
MVRDAVMSVNRSQRVGDLILREISSLLLRKVKDPRIKGTTITEVHMTKDLRIAYVYYSIFGQDANKKSAQEGFESAKGYIRKEIGEKIQLRYVPDIHFKYDNSLEYGQEMDNLLDKIIRN